MRRRAALKNLSLAFGGMLSLPDWAFGWTPDSVGGQSIVSITEESLLAEIVETIIPETNTPGAKSLQVHQFAMRMIKDCYGEPAQANLTHGLTKVESISSQAHHQSFTACNAQQRTDVLTQMSQSAEPSDRQFVEMIKALTIQGYQHSEYVMVNIQGYTMAPGFYHGCVPVKS
jgi:hypothetical protein